MGDQGPFTCFSSLLVASKGQTLKANAEPSLVSKTSRCKPAPFAKYSECCESKFLLDIPF